ncbi:ribonuclease H-like domain-containing protein, partial [Trametes maxima]
VMQLVGVERFSGICSDSAANTRKARELLAKAVPALLNLSDCCHHLQNTAKDITKLTDFKTFVSNLRKIVSYFRRSTKASAELATTRAEDGITRGLQSIGRTRFASIYWSADALKTCLPSIRQLISSGKLQLSRKLALLQEGNMASMKFEQALIQYTSILAPIARAIKSLEATDATAADVFVFWLGIASSLRELFARPEDETGVSPALAQKITGIINKRYKEII